ncbi:MAG: hypothetical protein HQ523_02330 [Lentisphaerae bacterium]|nr:hypothetical protein [Lentisphaerota bacterium]
MNRSGFTLFLFLVVGAAVLALAGGGDPASNAPCVDNSSDSSCECPLPDGGDNGCVRVRMAVGELPAWASLEKPFFQVLSEDPSPSLYTPAALTFSSGYAIHELAYGQTSGGVPRDVIISENRGLRVRYRFADGDPIAPPVFGDEDILRSRLIMVDAEGWSVTNEPAYYDLYPGDGDLYRFSASPLADDYLQMVFYRSVTGREESYADIGVEIIRDENGLFRQIFVPRYLCDVVTTTNESFSVLYYPRESVGPKDPGTGLYAPMQGVDPITVWTFTNPVPGTVNQLWVTKTAGDSTDEYRYSYDAGVEDWVLTHGGEAPIKTNEKTSLWNDSRTIRQRSQRILDADGNVVRRNSETIKYSGSWAGVTEAIKGDPNGDLKTTFTYDASGNTKTKEDANGEWTRYTYNGDNLITSMTRPWGNQAITVSDAVADLTGYSYTVLTNTDTVATGDRRPRTITRQVGGQVVSKEFHVYLTDPAAGYQDIVEYAATPDADYGDVGNSRKLETYYGTNAAAHAIGRLASVQRADGRLDLYAYDYGVYHDFGAPSSHWFEVSSTGSAWRVTVDHVAATATNGIPFTSIRSVAVSDAYGQEVLNETYVLDDASNYARIDWEVRSFDDMYHATTVWHANGTEESASWSGCCGKEYTKDASGVEMFYGYDELDFPEYVTKEGAGGADDLVTSYTTDVMGSRLSTTISGGALSLMTSSNAYDLAGRLVTSIDAAGIGTTYSYPGGGRTSVVSRADLTNVTVRYNDGRTHYTEQNGVRKQTYEYGVNAGGSQWTKTYTGPDGTASAMWNKATTDMLGRTIQQERPGFGGGTITNTYEYNTLSQLVKTSSPGSADTLYAYDQLGNQTTSCLDIDNNGMIDLAGPDRVASFDTSYNWLANQSLGDGWWRVNTSILYPESGSAAPVTNSISRMQLTGLGGSASSRTVSIDIHGNETVQTTAVDRDDKTVTQTVDTWDSETNAVRSTVNGLIAVNITKTGLAYTYSYDALERRTGVTDPRTGEAVTAYNSKAQVVYTEDTASNRTSYAYDPDTGRRTAVTNALGEATYYHYSPEGQLLATWGNVYPIAYEYDEFDRMSAMYTYRGTNEILAFQDFNLSAFDQTAWQYDEATGLLTNKVYADGNGTAYTHTPEGRLATRTWARGDITSYGYDDCCGALTNISYSDSSTPTIGFTYDRLGRQVTITDALGTREFTYNDALQLATETNVLGSMTRIYDDQGRTAGFSVGQDYEVGYAFDDWGRFSSVSSSVQSVSSVVNYPYEPNSDLLAGYTLTPGGSASSLTAARTYEPTRNLITSISNLWDSTPISIFAYENDKLGRRTERIDTSTLSALSTNEFAYNTRSELTSALMATNTYGYAYDPIGNRRTAVSDVALVVSTNSYLANELNQYTNIVASGVPPESPTYDADGNMLTHDGWTFSWNGENRLINASNSTHTISYSYDYMGRRFEKVVDDGSSVTTNTFLYDGWNLISEVSDDGSSVSTNHCVWGVDLSGSMQGAGGIGGLLTADLNGTNVFYCDDANGNVTDLVDTNGNSVAHYEHGPFGQTTAKTGTLADDNPFRFSTKYLDDETGLAYYGHRYYDPELGRWPSRDPIEEEAFVRVRAALGVEIQEASRFTSLPPEGSRQIESININEELPQSALELRNRVNVGGMDRTGFMFMGLKTEDGGTLYNFALNDPQNVVDPLGDFISFGASGCAISICAASGCLGSGCGASGCLGSGCGGSGCLGSACGASGCGGSACAGSGCVGSACGGSVCGGSACAVSLCAGSGCVGSACGVSGCAGSVCAGSGCVVSGCVGSLCVGSGCAGSACVGSACGVSGCAGSACGVSACLGSTCGASGCVGSTCAASGCTGSSCGSSGCSGSACSDQCCTTSLDGDILRSLDFNSDSNRLEIMIAVAPSGPNFMEIHFAGGVVEKKPLKNVSLNRIVVEGSHTIRRDSVQLSAHSINIYIEDSAEGGRS